MEGHDQANHRLVGFCFETGGDVDDSSLLGRQRHGVDIDEPEDGTGDHRAQERDRTFIRRVAHRVGADDSTVRQTVEIQVEVLDEIDVDNPINAFARRGVPYPGRDVFAAQVED